MEGGKRLAGHIPYEFNHRTVDGILEKKCLICNEWFTCTNEFFYKNKSNSIDGLNPYCKPCTSAKSLAYNYANYDKFKQSVAKRDSTRREELAELSRRRREEGKTKEWQQNNPDKLKEYRIKYATNKKHKITKKEWENCKRYFADSCAYCGITYDQHKEKLGTDLHKEHAINNGANDLSNCLPSCMSCNSEKHYHDYTEWYTEDNSKFSMKRLSKILEWLTEDYKKYINKKIDRRCK